MIKQRLWLFKWRRYLKTYRDHQDKCCNCGSSKGHETWCWGPKGLRIIWLVTKTHKIRHIRFGWESYKSGLEWAGVEPWHRY